MTNTWTNSFNTTAVSTLAAATLLVATPAQALDHNDRVSCYFHVHSTCFNNGKDPDCTEEDLAWGFGECDSAYPGMSARPPATPRGLKAKGRTMTIRATIANSFKN